MRVIAKCVVIALQIEVADRADVSLLREDDCREAQDFVRGVSVAG